MKLYPTRTTNSVEAMNALKKYFKDYSVPERLVSDQGSCFTCNQFQKFMETKGITHLKVASASPQSNGQVERLNRDLVPMLAKLIDFDKNIFWDHVLEKVEFVLNNTTNRSIGELPSIALFGVPQKQNVDDLELLFNSARLKDRDLNKIRHQIQENNEKAQYKYKEYFDRTRKNALLYKIGDLVMLKNIVTEVGINHKLLPKFRGPYIVSKILGNDRYIVEDVPGNQITNKRFKGLCAAFNMKIFDNNFLTDTEVNPIEDN